mmetsp:Transcript_44903/g.73157  ORF Transcript_44903/g.73157 Transcript_44903/m.73157 type:complete len:218 (+) Transcript_44903:5378-6031(+)
MIRSEKLLEREGVGDCCCSSQVEKEEEEEEEAATLRVEERLIPSLRKVEVGLGMLILRVRAAPAGELGLEWCEEEEEGEGDGAWIGGKGEGEGERRMANGGYESRAGISVRAEERGTSCGDRVGAERRVMSRGSIRKDAEERLTERCRPLTDSNTDAGAGDRVNSSGESMRRMLRIWSSLRWGHTLLRSSSDTNTSLDSSISTSHASRTRCNRSSAL